MNALLINIRRAIPMAVLQMLPFTAQAETNFRCGNSLLGVESSMAEIVSKCGEPAERQVSYLPVRYRNHAGEWKTDPRQAGSEVSEWLYNFGPDRLMLQLRFLDGQLQDVKTLGYGN